MNSKKTLSFILMLLIVIVGHAQQQKLSLEAFEQKLNQSARPQILDVRTPQEFSENHLIGAVNLSTTDTAGYTKKIEALRKQEPVFVYSINNGRSGVVAKQLREKGFSEVYELPGGIAHWIGAGKPIESKAGKGISTEEFQRAVASKNLVLVDVGSKYCGGCKKLVPIVDAVGREQADALDVFKIELYDNRALVSSLEIESVPTLILYKGSKPVWKKSGSITKEEIQDAIASAASRSSD
jgi:rhodanese-related sulfurtransferase